MQRNHLKTNGWILLATLVVAIAPLEMASAAPPWATLIPFKRIEADPNKRYELSEANGPWMVMCTSFAGPTADQQAHDLVLELRTRLKIEAYTFRQTFDFTQPFESRGVNRYGEPKMMRHLNATKFEEIAVMAGNFESMEHPQVEKTLEAIKHAHPATLETKYKEKSSQRFAGLRSFYKFASNNAEKKQRGPMGSAFVTRNPLLPDEYFATEGLDPFLVEINEDLKFSLLSNPGNYTVRIASFRGVDTMKPAEFEKLTSNRDKLAKIDEAALKASKLCAALREKGVEAYEFHDRTESIVTVGSFQEVGELRPDGKTEINPAVHQLIQQYGPVKTNIPGSSVQGLQARTLAGIAFDPQPWPVEVLTDDQVFMQVPNTLRIV
ncbi:MAG: hypothetical protein WD872_19755, partial [Pirellulaceae bacterium]